HLDSHALWEPQVFARSCFRIIMFSIQPQHSHLVIQQLLSHLDANSRSGAAVRAGIVAVLSEAAGIAATGAVGFSVAFWGFRSGIVAVLSEAAGIAATGAVVFQAFWHSPNPPKFPKKIPIFFPPGPTVLEVFNTLLRQLRLSIDLALAGSSQNSQNSQNSPNSGAAEPQNSRQLQESQFQEAVIKTIGSFSATLPPYQQSEVMVFIMNKVPIPENSQHSQHSRHFPEPASQPDGKEIRTRLTQIMLLKSLLQVAEGLRCSSLLTALPAAFLERLLAPALLPDAHIRLFVLDILGSFLDRRRLRLRLVPSSSIADVSLLKLKVEKCSRQDSVFMKKHGSALLCHAFRVCRLASSSPQHFRAVFRLLALLSLELGTDDVITDLLRLVLALQDVAQEELQLPEPSRCALAALGAALLHFLGHLLGIPAFLQHVQE
ncbi:protein EFR3 homolog B-like, partial [Haemorhous mexicanus]|uniref:protein EFR3 homolog B-like n=1 Tax=Haemorhous mexicanus TaxID=30427 RepID=UPI0028BE00C2